MKKSNVYIRVSSDEQKKGYSPANQIRQAREYAQMQGYQVNKIYDDSGKSGRTTDRRIQLQEMLNDMKEDPVEAVIIYKVDRFARNLRDFTTLYEDFKSKGIKLLSINEGNLTEGTSLIANLFASVAQWESEVNSLRTKDALQQKFEEGWQPTPPPIGYRTVEVE